MKRGFLSGLIAVLAIALAWTWVFGTSSDTRCVEIYDNLPEGSSFRNVARAWPPGTKCVYELQSGREETRSTFP